MEKLLIYVPDDHIGGRPNDEVGLEIQLRAGLGLNQAKVELVCETLGELADVWAQNDIPKRAAMLLLIFI